MYNIECVCLFFKKMTCFEITYDKYLFIHILYRYKKYFLTCAYEK